MTSSEFSEQDLERLIEAYLDERLSAVDVARVEALLSEDRQAREVMLDILQCRGALLMSRAARRERSCREAMRSMPPYRRGTLPPRETAVFARHLEACLECRQTWRAYERGDLDVPALLGTRIERIVPLAAPILVVGGMFGLLYLLLRLFR